MFYRFSVITKNSPELLVVTTSARRTVSANNPHCIIRNWITKCIDDYASYRSCKQGPELNTHWL